MVQAINVLTRVEKSSNTNHNSLLIKISQIIYWDLKILMLAFTEKIRRSLVRNRSDQMCTLPCVCLLPVSTVKRVYDLDLNAVDFGEGPWANGALRTVTT